jgi:hypothetical protein
MLARSFGFRPPLIAYSGKQSPWKSNMSVGRESKKMDSALYQAIPQSALAIPWLLIMYGLPRSGKFRPARRRR